MEVMSVLSISHKNMYPIWQRKKFPYYL